MNGGVVCILPIRSLIHGKSRLSAVLGNLERARLNDWLLERMLDCLEEQPGAAATLVVSGSIEVLERARRRGMIGIADPPSGGLNEAVAEATAVASARGATGVFILPVDLPLVTPAGLRDLLAATPPAPACLLTPDRSGLGTNFLYQSPIRLTSYAFGEGSFARHCAAAEAVGLKVSVRREPSFAFDLDLPADYALWRRLTGEAPVRNRRSVDIDSRGSGQGAGAYDA
jgi:2-phospho-L-lactate/phosphoenolpyruvate guanylyltransferase